MPTELKEQTMTPEELDLLMQEYKRTGSQELRNRLVLHYSYIAKSVAVKMNSTFHKYASIEEMVNQGVIAIIDSLERFDPEQNVKFSTYAFTKVRGSVIDYVRKQDWLPRRVRRMGIQMNRIQDEMTVELGREPTREEMAERLQMTPQELDQQVYEVSGETMYSYESLLGAPTQAHNSFWPWGGGELDPEDSFDEDELRRMLAASIEELSEQERTVLSLYYYENLTMKEIGQVMGVSEQRIGQVNRKLVQKLREKLTTYMKG